MRHVRRVNPDGRRKTRQKCFRLGKSGEKFVQPMQVSRPFRMSRPRIALSRVLKKIVGGANVLHRPLLNSISTRLMDAPLAVVQPVEDAQVAESRLCWRGKACGDSMRRMHEA